MRILDIDLDVFVSPKIINREENGIRPCDDGYEIPSEEEVTSLVTEKWQINSNTPIHLLERHVEIIECVESLIRSGELTPPFKWFHIDAHDDFFGHHGRPVNSENFMFEIIRRGWCDVICWIYPDGEFEFQREILSFDFKEIRFDGYRARVLFEELSKFRLGVPPDFAFLTRSPEFSPAKADRLYDLIAAIGIPHSTHSDHSRS